MKHQYFITLTFLLLICTHISNAQEEYEHLFKNRSISFSIMAGPIFEFSSVHGNFGFSSGGGGALLLNQAVFIGGYGMRLSPVIGKEVNLQGVNYENLEIAFGHGGFWLGYIHNHRKLFHLGGSTKFGWGNISLEDNRLPSPYEDNVLVITPQIEAEVNISRWFRINFGVGYRFVTGTNENVFERRDFNSPEATLSFIFGWFR